MLSNSLRQKARSSWYWTFAGREEECFRILQRAGSLPAIVLCDRDDKEYVVRAYEMGADGYLVKPFSPYELIAKDKSDPAKDGHSR